MTMNCVKTECSRGLSCNCIQQSVLKRLRKPISNPVEQNVLREMALESTAYTHTLDISCVFLI
jgi:hypothetical protein